MSPRGLLPAIRQTCIRSGRPITRRWRLERTRQATCLAPQPVAAPEEVRIARSANTQLPMDWSRDGAAILLYVVGGDTMGGDLSVCRPTRRRNPGGAVSQLALQRMVGTLRARSPSRNGSPIQADDWGGGKTDVDTFPEPSVRRQVVRPAAASFPSGVLEGEGTVLRRTRRGALMSVRITRGGASVDSFIPNPLFRMPIVDTGRSPVRRSDPTASVFSSGPFRGRPRNHCRRSSIGRRSSMPDKI